MAFRAKCKTLAKMQTCLRDKAKCGHQEAAPSHISSHASPTWLALDWLLPHPTRKGPSEGWRGGGVGNQSTTRSCTILEYEILSSLLSSARHTGRAQQCDGLMFRPANMVE
jgi:hypothetical protein